MQFISGHLYTIGTARVCGCVHGGKPIRVPQGSTVMYIKPSFIDDSHIILYDSKLLVYWKLAAVPGMNKLCLNPLQVKDA